MQVKRHRLLHWLLIITMAMLPLRIALAVNPGCGMHEHGDNLPAAQVMHNHTGQMAMRGHAGHSMMNREGPIVGMDHMAHQAADQPTTINHCCCYDGVKDGCSSDCSMGLHASAIINSIFSITVSYQPRIVAVASDALHTRELTPPSRPPLSLYV